MRPFVLLSLGLALVSVAAPSGASAQGAESEWAASSTGHLAFVNRDRDDETSVLRVLDPEGRPFPPEPVTSGTAAPIVALGARGDALVVWDDDAEHLWARYRPPAGPLGPPERVTTGPVRSILPASLGLDASGTATLVWVPSDGHGGPHVHTRTEAGAWDRPRALGGRNVYEVDLAVTDNGSGVLAWTRVRDRGAPNRRQLVATTRAPGGTFGPVQVVAGVQRGAGGAMVAGNDRGDAVVGWSQSRRLRGARRNPLEFSTHAVFRSPGRRFGAPVQLNHTRDMAARGFAVLPDATMVFGWTDNRLRRAEVRVRTPAGRLAPARIVTRDLLINSDLYPLAVGHGAIAWLTGSTQGPATVRVARARPDGRWLQSTTIGRVRGAHYGPAFAVSAASLIAVPRQPLTPTDPIPWTRVPG